MGPQIRARLGLLMFFEYFIWGAWYVTIGTWLSMEHHFNGQQIGLVAGTTAIGAIIAPSFVGLIADRLFDTEKILAFLHITGGVLLFIASQQSRFNMIYALLLLYCLCFMPTLALSNSLSFGQMKDPKIQFGPIRVFGTLGWIAAGLLVGVLKLEKTAYPLMIAATSSLLLGCYCYSLPHTPPHIEQNEVNTKSAFFKDTLKLLTSRPMAVFAIASFFICVPLQFYYTFTNMFLNSVGVPDAAGKMTVGQMSEMLCMLLIPWFFRRLGVKYMLAVGMFAWVLRYTLFAFGNAGPRFWMLWLGIVLHGVCYDFFFVTGQIYIDRVAPAGMRAAAQGLIAFITYGLGMFVGSWLSGEVVERNARQLSPDLVLYNWQAIWLFATGASALVLLGFLFSFSERKSRITKNFDAQTLEGVPL